MSDKTADTENKDVEKFEEPTQENVKTFQTFTFKDLQQFGGVVDRKPVQKQIEWDAKDGTKLVGDIWVRRQSFENFSSFLDKSYTDKNKVALAALIAKSLASDETGKKDLFTYDQACSLDYGLALVLIAAIHEVNGATKKN